MVVVIVVVIFILVIHIHEATNVIVVFVVANDRHTNGILHHIANITRFRTHRDR